MTESPENLKIHAYIAKLGITSRRKAEELVADGKVTVNGEVAHVGQRVLPGKDQIALSGEVLSEAQTLRYFIVNKPRGVVSTTSDEQGRAPITSLLPKSVTERLYPVGRLDMDSEGLMLLTNDGALAQQLTHPSFEILKTYEVLVDRRPTGKAINHLMNGVKLREGFTKPADVSIVGEEGNGQTWLSVTISEGRNHQVRRMLERVGYDTVRLIRTQLGTLDIGMLDDEKVRELTEEEVSELKANTKLLYR